MLCDVKIFLLMYDRSNGAKLVHYQSDAEDDYIKCMLKDCYHPTKNFFSNLSYDALLKKPKSGSNFFAPLEQPCYSQTSRPRLPSFDFVANPEERPRYLAP